MDRASEKLLHDQDLIRLQNKSLGVCLCSSPKKLEFYANATKQVVFQDATNKYEKVLNIPMIEQNKTEVLNLVLDHIAPSHYRTELSNVLSAFRVIKLARRLHEFSAVERGNLQNPIIEPYLESTKDKHTSEIKLGEPILLRSEINDLYLGVRKFTKKNLVLSSLENPSCEYLFVLSAKGKKSGTITYADSFEIKSFIGGRIVLVSNPNELNQESFIAEPNTEQIEDQEQIRIEEKLQEFYSNSSDLKKIEPVNITIPINYSLRHFRAEPLSDFERELTLQLSEVLARMVDYYIFLQDWAVVSGKQLKMSMANNPDQRILDENFYYDYEEASETHDKLINHTNKLLATLKKLHKQMFRHNYISDFNWLTRQLSPSLALKARQKALLEIGFFDYILLLVKLTLQKSYQSLDFEKLFKVVFDVDGKKEADSFARRNKMRRLLQTDTIDWKIIRQTPQHVCRNELDKVLRICLDLILTGVKDNPNNVMSIADSVDQFYYLVSFFKQTSVDILLEVAKYMVYKEENHVAFN